MKRVTLYAILLLSASSCVVTNSLYVNDPVPVMEGVDNLYLGVGTGFRPEIESVDTSGNVTFANEISVAPTLFFGGQVALIPKVDLRFAVHLPYLIGGFGGRLGPQVAFFDKKSPFNLALGADLGFVLARDSLKIFGSTTALAIYANGAINADCFLAMGYQFNENTKLVITPRYSFNTLFIRKNTLEKETVKFKPQLPSLAVGMYLKHVYIEASAVQFQDKYFPNFGLVYVFKPTKRGGSP